MGRRLVNLFYLLGVTIDAATPNTWHVHAGTTGMIYLSVCVLSCANMLVYTIYYSCTSQMQPVVAWNNGLHKVTFTVSEMQHFGDGGGGQ